MNIMLLEVYAIAKGQHLFVSSLSLNLLYHCMNQFTLYYVFYKVQ